MPQSSRSAIKKYIADNASTTIPSGVTYFNKIQVTRYEPKLATLGATVVCWIGESRRKVSRLSLGRGAGQKTAEWAVQLMVMATSSNESAALDQFEAIVDSVAESYETLSLSPPPTITDPITGSTSTVLVIGESWSDVEYRTEFTEEADKQSRVTFRAIITIPVTEYLSQI